MGDFTASGVNENPTHKLDVIGNGRFRYLPDSLYFADSTVNKIVMVDSKGVLRWANAVPGKICVPCSDTVNGKLDFNTKIDLNNHNFYFTKNDSLGQNHVGVGFECGEKLPGKISVLQIHPEAISDPGTETIAGYFHNQDYTETFFTTFKGVHGRANRFNMNDGGRNLGGYFEADSAIQSIGAAGLALTGKYSIGLYGEANGGSISNIGVYGVASGSNAWAGYFDGDVFATNYTTSDINLKQNIQDFEDANTILSQLNPVRYNYKTVEYPQLHLSTAPQIGLIAQDVEQVLPDAVRDTKSPVKYDEFGTLIEESVEFKAVSYEKLIPVLVAGHQEQQAKIEELEAKLEEMMLNYQKLEACLMNKFPDLCEVRQGMIQNNTIEKQAEIIHSLNVNLSSKNNIILNQNVPNPFAEQTVITYSVPATVAKAQIHFYDGMGKLIQSVDITERGEGQLNVFGADLSSGVYTYSLVADGKIVDTKRMVKE